MILNRIEPGTACKIRESGKQGSVKKIYFYPTKFEIEFPDGHIAHYSSKDIEFDEIKQKPVHQKLSKIPEYGLDQSWSVWSPFEGESFLRYHFSTTKEIMWKMLTSLETYNVWFFGIQRSLPVLEKERYVHKYSFNELEMKPGSSFKIRSRTVAPYFECRIMTLEKEKKFGFTFQNLPFLTEYIEFTIEETEAGVWVNCDRKSIGPSSFLHQLNWNEKSAIFTNLDKIIPKVDFTKSKSEEIKNNSSDEKNVSVGGYESLSAEAKVLFLVNKGLDGDMEVINSEANKVLRGKTKAMIVKINRGTIERPPMPEIPTGESAPVNSGGGIESLSKDEQIAYLVNKGLDGDMDSVNKFENRVLRGKAKAMIVKINRGTVERPPMPEIPTSGSAPVNSGGGIESLSKDEQIAYLVNKGLDGDMDSVNKFENRVLRGKAKAMIVKINRGTIERPPMPELSSSNSEVTETVPSETEETMILRLVNSGIEGNMDEINKLDNRVMRGKIKAAIMKAKRGIKK